MCVAGEKKSKPLERAAGHRDNPRPGTIQPQASEECGKSEDENADRKSQRYLRNAPSELLCQGRAKDAPRINRTECDLEEHSRDRDYPSITRSHGLITGVL